MNYKLSHGVGLETIPHYFCVVGVYMWPLWAVFLFGLWSIYTRDITFLSRMCQLTPDSTVRPNGRLLLTKVKNKKFYKEKTTLSLFFLITYLFCFFLQQILPEYSSRISHFPRKRKAKGINYEFLKIMEGVHALVYQLKYKILSPFDLYCTCVQGTVIDESDGFHSRVVGHYYEEYKYCMCIALL